MDARGGVQLPFIVPRSTVGPDSALRKAAYRNKVLFTRTGLSPLLSRIRLDRPGAVTHEDQLEHKACRFLGWGRIYRRHEVIISRMLP